MVMQHDSFDESPLASRLKRDSVQLTRSKIFIDVNWSARKTQAFRDLAVLELFVLISH